MEHICKFCGKSIEHYKRKCWVCGTCNQKNIYFKGLYWEALARDNNKCIDCGRNDITLNIHHKNHNHLDNRLDNLETLCVNCHSKKRKTKCIDCKRNFIANSARQIRCLECGRLHENVMSLKRQLRYWKGRNPVRANWYINKINNI